MILKKEPIEDKNSLMILDWLRFIDKTGYISYSEFVELPSGITDYVNAIRFADTLKLNYEELSNVEDKVTRKKLTSNIQELEAFFK